MSDNQVAYLPRCTTDRVSESGTPASGVRGAIAFDGTEFSTTGFSTTGFSGAASVFATAASVDGMAVSGMAASGMAVDDAALDAQASTPPKQGHNDLGTAVMTDEARGWDRRPRRLSLAR